MPFQFTLQTLLLSVVVIWSSMAAFGPWGLVLAFWIVFAVGFVRAAKSNRRTWAATFLVTLCPILLLLLSVQTPPQTSRGPGCGYNLKQIAESLWGYHDDHGCMPPAYVPGADSKPAHSWRVLLLPYMGEQALYDQYDFNEAWNGPNNRKLAQRMPECYFCPGDPQAGPPMTDYVAVVGPNTVWSEPKAGKKGHLPKGSDRTIMVMEVADSSFHWMAPKDLSFEQARRGIGTAPIPDVLCRHTLHTRRPAHFYDCFYEESTGANVAFVDGSVHSLSADVSRESLEALLTVDPEDAIDWSEIDRERNLNWSRCIALIVLAASTLLLLLRPRR